MVGGVVVVAMDQACGVSGRGMVVECWRRGGREDETTREMMEEGGKRETRRGSPLTHLSQLATSRRQDESFANFMFVSLRVAAVSDAVWTRLTRSAPVIWMSGGESHGGAMPTRGGKRIEIYLKR